MVNVCKDVLINILDAMDFKPDAVVVHAAQHSLKIVNSFLVFHLQDLLSHHQLVQVALMDMNWSMMIVKK